MFRTEERSANNNQRIGENLLNKAALRHTESMEREKEEIVEESINPTPTDPLSYPVISEETIQHENMPYLPPLLESGARNPADHSAYDYKIIERPVNDISSPSPDRDSSIRNRFPARVINNHNSPIRLNNIASEERNIEPLPRVNRLIPVSNGVSKNFHKNNYHTNFLRPQKEISSNEGEVEIIPRRQIAPVQKKSCFKGNISESYV